MGVEGGLILLLRDRKTRAALRFACVALTQVVDYKTYPYSINQRLTKKEAANVLYQLLKQPIKGKENKYRAMLERLEWSLQLNEHAGMVVCPSCGGTKETGHKPDCELAALLKGE
jgi:enterochelin esterase-like enzyme